MQTGQPFGAMYNQAQQTGFVAPQQTGFNPFGQQQQQPFGQQQQPVQAFAGGLQPQQTGFLVPQTTGANPFRQSTLFPQSTGMPGPFGFPQQQQAQPQVPAATGVNNPFPTGTQPFGQQQPSYNPFPSNNQFQQQPQQSTTNPFPSFGSGPSGNTAQTPSFSQQAPMGSTNPFPSFSSNVPSGPTPTAPAPSSGPPTNGLPRSASVPPSSAPSNPAPLKTHQTGSRNPFGVPVTAAPPVPKIPTLFELSMGQGQTNVQQQPQANGTTSPPPSNPASGGFGTTGGTNGSLIANVASEFALSSNNNATQNAHTNGLSGLSFSSSLQRSTSPTATGSTTMSNSLFSSLSSQPTGATSTSSPTALQPQTTGFSALKPFKPSSSFGAALLESLPPIPQSAPGTPPEQSKPTTTGPLGTSSLTAQPTGLGSSLFGGGSGVGTASTVGVGLRPQATGLAGQANPFRATMFSLSPGPTGNAFSGGLASNPTGNAFGGGIGSGLGANPTGLPSQFGQNTASAFGGAFGASASAPNNLNTQQQQQQHAGQSSLI